MKKETEKNEIPISLHIDKIITKYDYPLLLTAKDATNRTWIFSWADTDEQDEDDYSHSSIHDTWFAFPVSAKRMRQILEEHISLREAILFYETDLFLLTAHRPLLQGSDIISWKKLNNADTPLHLLPLIDISIKGKRLMPVAKDNGVLIEAHIIPKRSLEGLVPLEIVSPLMDLIQKIVRLSSNFVKKGKSRELFFQNDDLGKLNFVSLEPGSITFKAETRELETDKNKPVITALNYIKEMVESKDLLKFLQVTEERIGLEALLNLHFLLSLQLKQEINITIKYVLNGGGVNSLTLPIREAKIIFRALTSYLGKGIGAFELVIKLTAEEKDLLMKPVAGEGGWQSLMRQLKKQITNNNKLFINQRQLERIIRYSQLYGVGGWQKRLEVILNKLRTLG
jgi:hypothetical protein